MTILNQLLCRVFDALVYPLRGLPTLASLAVLSLLTAMGMLLVFRATSNQGRIAAAKRRIQAGLFEMRLFNDDPRTILQAQADIMRHNFSYLRLSLVPMLWMIVPLTLAVAQMQSFYGYVAPRPGEAFLLELKLRPEGTNEPKQPAKSEGQEQPARSDGPEEPARADGQTESPRPDVQLRLPPGLRAETADVWVPALSELAWRIRAERPGRYQLEVLLEGEAYAKDVRVTVGFERLSPVRQAPGFAAQLLYPAEPPLPDSRRVQSIRVTHAPRDFPLFGWRLPWMAVYFLLVVVFAFLLKSRLRVTL